MAKFKVLKNLPPHKQLQCKQWILFRVGWLAGTGTLKLSCWRMIKIWHPKIAIMRFSSLDWKKWLSPIFFVKLSKTSFMVSKACKQKVVTHIKLKLKCFSCFFTILFYCKKIIYLFIYFFVIQRNHYHKYGTHKKA